MVAELWLGKEHCIEEEEDEFGDFVEDDAIGMVQQHYCVCE